MNGEGSNSRNGYPSIEPKGKTVSELMTSVFFMSEERWNESRVQGNFDYVVIGSSFCAWAFTKRMLEKNPKAKILILERGEYNYLEHFENLPPSCKRRFTYESKTCHWATTKAMREGKYIKKQDGINDVFGGQSGFWRGWCPRPTREELDGWPESVKDIIEKYFTEAAELINVVRADQIGMNGNKCYKDDGHCCVFGELQTVLVEKMKSCLPEAFKRVEHASFSLKADKNRYGRIQKTSVAQLFLDLLLAKKVGLTEEEQISLEIKISCEVEKILHKDGKAVTLQTNQGNFELGGAKLILAMGVLPPTTLMLNSFPLSSFKQLAGIGTRYTAHFRSSVIARLPISGNGYLQEVYHNLTKKPSARFEVAAMYIPGLSHDSNRQFHVQLSAFLDDTPYEDLQNTVCQLPDIFPTLWMEQLKLCKDQPYIVFVCKTIGGLDHDNENNWFRLNEDITRNTTNEDITRNTTLHVEPNAADLQLWKTMDAATFELLKKLDDHCQMEFWRSSTESWQKERPPKSEIRRDVLVHPASTMWIGDDQSSSPVDLNYRFRGVENVFLTGGALWPSSGSWNPTCTMTALAMDLADKLLS